MQEYLNWMQSFYSLCVHKLKVEKKPQLYGRMKWQLAAQSWQTKRKYCGVNLTSEVIQSIFNGKIIWIKNLDISQNHSQYLQCGSIFKIG